MLVSKTTIYFTACVCAFVLTWNIESAAIYSEVFSNNFEQVFAVPTNIILFYFVFAIFGYGCGMIWAKHNFLKRAKEVIPFFFSLLTYTIFGFFTLLIVLLQIKKDSNYFYLDFVSSFCYDTLLTLFPSSVILYFLYLGICRNSPR